MARGEESRAVSYAMACALREPNGGVMNNSEENNPTPGASPRRDLKWYAPPWAPVYGATPGAPPPDFEHAPGEPSPHALAPSAHTAAPGAFAQPTPQHGPASTMAAPTPPAPAQQATHHDNRHTPVPSRDLPWPLGPALSPRERWEQLNGTPPPPQNPPDNPPTA